MIKIRPAKLADSSVLVELNHKIFVNNKNYDDDIKEDPAPISYFEQLVEKKDSCFLVLEEDKQMIGYTDGSPLHFGYRKSKYFEINTLGILPEKTGKGFGKMLLNAITEWAKEQGYQKMYINCYIKNTEALDFYKKNGYSEIDVCLEKSII